MAFVHYTLTMVANTPQSLGVALAAAAVAQNVPAASLDVPLRCITFQALKANTTDIFIGGQNQTVSSTSHAIRVDAGDTAPPIVMGSYDSGGQKISDFVALGASGGEVLLIGGVTY